MPGFWIFFFLASVIGLVAGLRMKPEIFNPSDPFSGTRVTSRVGLIIVGSLGILLSVALVIVSFLKSSGRMK